MHPAVMHAHRAAPKGTKRTSARDLDTSMCRDAIIVLPQDASEQEVAQILNGALADEAGLQRKAAHAMRLGLQHFTCHRKAERVLDYVAAFR